jgi:hypothetical protein
MKRQATSKEDTMSPAATAAAPDPTTIACPPDGANTRQVRRWVDAHHAAVTAKGNVTIDRLKRMLADLAGSEIEMVVCVEHYDFEGPQISRGVFAYQSYTGPLTRLVGEHDPRWAFEAWISDSTTGESVNGEWLFVPTAASEDDGLLGIACGHAGETVYLRAV